jgi:hypothetical protein
MLRRLLPGDSAAASTPVCMHQVLVLPSYGLSTAAAPVPRHPLQCPVKLTDTDPLLVYLAAESAAYWRGLEMQASCTLLSQQPTLDVVQHPDRDHPGAVGFSKLQARTRFSLQPLNNS